MLLMMVKKVVHLNACFIGSQFLSLFDKARKEARRYTEIIERKTNLFSHFLFYTFDVWSLRICFCLLLRLVWAPWWHQTFDLGSHRGQSTWKVPFPNMSTEPHNIKKKNRRTHTITFREKKRNRKWRLGELFINTLHQGCSMRIRIAKFLKCLHFTCVFSQQSFEESTLSFVYRWLI